MKLEYGQDNTRTVVSYPKTIKDMLHDMNEYTKKLGISYYYRNISLGEKEWRIDFGSYTKFFFVTDLPENALAQLHNA